MFWCCRKIRVTIATKRKEANMLEAENMKDKSKETKSMKESPEALSLKRNKSMRPQRLPSKTGCFHNVYLPIYEESQVKYEKFLGTLN